MGDIFLAADIGTTAVKVAAYKPSGQQIAFASRTTKVLRPAEGCAEQDMNAAWSLVADALREVSAAVEGETLVALGICAQGDGCWPVGDNGRALRPAILWSDARSAATSDLEHLRKTGGHAAVGRACRTDLWPGTSAMGWRWLKKHEPDVAEATRHVVTCGDWIGLQLTGNLATDRSNATIPFLDLETGDYGSAISALDCDDLLEKLLPPRSATEILGHVTASAAATCNLPAGLPVSVATLDLSAMMVGMGLNKPGQVMAIMGTTAVVNVLTHHPPPTDTPLAASVLHATEDLTIRVLAPTTGATAFDWFASLHPLSLGGDSPLEVSEKLNELAAKIPPGANGVTFLPYLSGERAPFVDPSIRGAFQGLSATTSKAEMGRAVMEGTALSLRHCLADEGHARLHEPVQLTGGGARNPLWCQIIAEVLGQPVLVNQAADLGLWGAACIAKAAVEGGDPVSLSSRMESITVYQPEAANVAAYDTIFKRYQLLSKAQRSLSEAIKKLGEP